MNREETMRTKEVDLLFRDAEFKKLEKNLDEKVRELFAKENFLDSIKKSQEEQRAYLLHKEQQFREHLKLQK